MTDLSAHPTQADSAWFADFQSALERHEASMSASPGVNARQVSAARLSTRSY